MILSVFEHVEWQLEEADLSDIIAGRPEAKA
jgi:hypothetical protein